MTARNGGGPARRAVTRWSLRLLRQERRQQVVVIALITFAVFAAVLAATAAYNVVPSRDAELGTASHRIDRRVTDPTAVDRYLRSARHWFGPVEIIGNRPVSVPGSTKAIDLRAQEIGGRFGAPMLAVRAGRLPASLGEVAFTDDVASLLSASIGDKVTLGDSTYEVVGLVENPADLNDAFALTASSPVRAGDLLSVLISADGKRVQTFRPATEPGTGAVAVRGRAEGATPRHLRSAMAANGTAVGGGVVAGARPLAGVGCRSHLRAPTPSPSRGTAPHPRRGGLHHRPCRDRARRRPQLGEAHPLLFLAGLVAVVVATVLLASPSLRIV